MPGRSVTDTVWARSWDHTSASSSAEEQSKPMISRSKRVRKLLPQASRYTASSRFVFPWALGPVITLVPGAKSTLSHS